MWPVPPQNWLAARTGREQQGRNKSLGPQEQGRQRPATPGSGVALGAVAIRVLASTFPVRSQGATG